MRPEATYRFQCLGHAPVPRLAPPPDFVVARILNLLNIPQDMLPRWGEHHVWRLWTAMASGGSSGTGDDDLSAAVIRIATGSATVATITGAGIVLPVVDLIPGVNRELLVLATGAGSLILSHVNDAGFWLVKQYFNMTVVETFKTWTAMETILSVVGLIFIMLLSLVV